MYISISPSIAAGNILALRDEVNNLEAAGADALHVDVMDGHFVPLLTLGVPFVEALKKHSKLPIDVHIMVSNPDAVAADYLTAGADTLTFHIEAAIHAHRICQQIKQAGKRAGIALNPATSWRSIEFLLPMLNQVTIMTVNPGYSRQQHLSDMHDKIKQLSEHCRAFAPHVCIQVDGGVNATNIANLAKLGASDFVAGGAVMGQSSYSSAITTLRTQASEIKV